MSGGAIPQNGKPGANPYQQNIELATAIRANPGRYASFPQYAKAMQIAYATMEGHNKEDIYGVSYYGKELTDLKNIKNPSQEIIQKIARDQAKFDAYSQDEKYLQEARQALQGSMNLTHTQPEGIDTHTEIVKNPIQNGQVVVTTPNGINVNVRGVVQDKSGNIVDILKNNDRNYINGYDQYDRLIYNKSNKNDAPLNVQDAGKFVDNINRNYEAQVLIATQNGNEYDVKVNPNVHMSSGQKAVFDENLLKEGFNYDGSHWSYIKPTEPAGNPAFVFGYGFNNGTNLKNANSSIGFISEPHSKYMSIDTKAINDEREKISESISNFVPNAKTSSMDYIELADLSKGRLTNLKNIENQLKQEADNLSKIDDPLAYNKSYSQFAQDYKAYLQGSANYNADIAKINYDMPKMDKNIKTDRIPNGLIGTFVYPVGKELVLLGNESDKLLRKLANDTQKKTIIDGTLTEKLENPLIPYYTHGGKVVSEFGNYIMDTADTADLVRKYSANSGLLTRDKNRNFVNIDGTNVNKDTVKMLTELYDMADSYRKQAGGIANIPKDTGDLAYAAGSGMVDYTLKNPERSAIETFMMLSPSETVQYANNARLQVNAIKNVLTRTDDNGKWNPAKGYMESFAPGYVFTMAGLTKDTTEKLINKDEVFNTRKIFIQNQIDKLNEINERIKGRIESGGKYDYVHEGEPVKPIEEDQAKIFDEYRQTPEMKDGSYITGSLSSVLIKGEPLNFRLSPKDIELSVKTNVLGVDLPGNEVQANNLRTAINEVVPDQNQALHIDTNAFPTVKVYYEGSGDQLDVMARSQQLANKFKSLMERGNPEAERDTTYRTWDYVNNDKSMVEIRKDVGDLAELQGTKTPAEISNLMRNGYENYGYYYDKAGEFTDKTNSNWTGHMFIKDVDPVVSAYSQYLAMIDRGANIELAKASFLTNVGQNSYTNIDRAFNNVLANTDVTTKYADTANRIANINLAKSIGIDQIGTEQIVQPENIEILSTNGGNGYGYHPVSTPQTLANYYDSVNKSPFIGGIGNAPYNVVGGTENYVNYSPKQIENYSIPYYTNKETSYPITGDYHVNYNIPVDYPLNYKTDYYTQKDNYYPTETNYKPYTGIDKPYYAPTEKTYPNTSYYPKPNYTQEPYYYGSPEYGYAPMPPYRVPTFATTPPPTTPQLQNVKDGGMEIKGYKVILFAGKKAVTMPGIFLTKKGAMNTGAAIADEDYYTAFKVVKGKDIKINTPTEFGDWHKFILKGGKFVEKYKYRIKPYRGKPRVREVIYARHNNILPILREM